tara:strand:- start:11 stop:181 length:171 start_codon:yes stop_codon:yes gene_type:complete
MIIITNKILKKGLPFYKSKPNLNTTKNISGRDRHALHNELGKILLELYHFQRLSLQ